MTRIVCMLLTMIGIAAAALAGPTRQQVVAGKASSLTLPQEVSTPDGMTVGKDGRIYLNVLNLQVAAGAAVWTLDAEHNLQKLVDLPAHAKTKGVYPLGIAQGPDGNLYVADNQTFGGHMDHQSRLLRVKMQNGKAVSVETVVTGFIAANAVEVHKRRVYVTETCLIEGATPHVSGIYVFDLSELTAVKPVALKPNGKDHRLIAQMTTTADDWRKNVGANGLAITPEGQLFVCNFGEASVLTSQLRSDGYLAKPFRVLARGQGMGSTDGMKYVADWKVLVVADFFSNAVHLIDTRSGSVKTLAKNPNSTGADGKLDKPSEPCVRGTTLYVSNIDLPYDDNKPDKPDTLTVIPLTAQAK